MSGLVINRVYIKNFKTIDEATLSFENSHLNILDGPNGFGKTTIFDAIELLVTGEIRRIKNTQIVHGSKGFNDILLSKYQNQETVIKVEFKDIEDTTNTITLARALTELEGLRNRDKRPEEFSKYKLYKLEEFNDQVTEGVQIDDLEINSYLNVAKVSEKFNMYHYVEQEDYSHLFKLTESERMDSISKLFNIEKEIGQQGLLKRVKLKLQNEFRELSNNMDSEQRYFDADRTVPETKEEVTYHRVLPEDLSRNVYWDQVNEPIGNDDKFRFFEELNNILTLVLNFNDFKKELINENIEKIAKNEGKLKAVITCMNFYNDMDRIRSKYKVMKRLLVIKDNLMKRELFDKELDWDYIFEVLDLQFSKEEILNLIREIKILNNNSTNLASIVENLNEVRENLKSQYGNYLENINDEEDKLDCPFCGQEWSNQATLFHNYNKQTTYYKSLYDETTAEIDAKKKYLFEERINSILEVINKLLEKGSTYNINSLFVEQLEEHIEEVTNFNTVKQWFDNLGINLEEYVNRSENPVDSLELRTEALRLSLLSYKSEVSDVVKDNMIMHKHLYTEVFKKRDDIVKSLTKEIINGKKSYLEYLNYLKANEAFSRYKSLDMRKNKVEKLLKEVDEILIEYTKQINSHRAKMIKDVEIPFYIYSGKIIQNHQRGMGVFIKEGNNPRSGESELKSINFIPPSTTDHDVLHSFSSGQLSATVLAFSLALNKVYSKKGFLTLLIDDPLQTMDDMNMVSFVEMLRNDFKDKQIIISTHEDKISMFMRYKYLKYGYDVKSHNVKELFYRSVY
ncbi:AAA family ATPase [Pseudalkalibacillus hwajinpoensis]|uniref:AAA family ATPase n=1 Tax=Guptibacillus hwajinpoensis TaxID=208199 RepID=UPI00325A7D77